MVRILTVAAGSILILTASTAAFAQYGRSMGGSGRGGTGMIQRFMQMQQQQNQAMQKAAAEKAAAEKHRKQELGAKRREKMEESKARTQQNRDALLKANAERAKESAGTDKPAAKEPEVKETPASAKS
jgi:hypothetical protein